MRRRELITTIREAVLSGAGRTGAKAFAVLALFTVPATVHAQAIPGAVPESQRALTQGEWPAYGGTYAAARYSPLTQIRGKTPRTCAWSGAGHRLIRRSMTQSHGSGRVSQMNQRR